MNRAKKFLELAFSAIPIVIGLAGIIFAATNGWSTLYDFHLGKEFLIITGLLSGLLLSSGYERVIQRFEIQNRITDLCTEFETLKKDLFKISRYQVIEGKENIMRDSIDEINRVKSSIRSTTFKEKENEDTSPEYYEALAARIKAKGNKLIYKCCFNKENSLSNRKKAFKRAKLTKENYERMFYYQFENQYYFNFLIIDESVVYIGFPLTSRDKHMQIALKIKAENNEEAKEFINSLVNWYEGLLVPKGIPVETAELLKD